MQIIFCILLQVRFIRVIEKVINTGYTHLQLILLISQITACQLQGKSIHLIRFFLRTMQPCFINRSDFPVFYHSIHRTM